MNCCIYKRRNCFTEAKLSIVCKVSTSLRHETIAGPFHKSDTSLVRLEQESKSCCHRRNSEIDVVTSVFSVQCCKVLWNGSKHFQWPTNLPPTQTSQSTLNITLISYSVCLIPYSLWKVTNQSFAYISRIDRIVKVCMHTTPNPTQHPPTSSHTTGLSNRVQEEVTQGEKKRMGENIKRHDKQRVRGRQKTSTTAANNRWRCVSQVFERVLVRSNI